MGGYFSKQSSKLGKVDVSEVRPFRQESVYGTAPQLSLEQKHARTSEIEQNENPWEQRLPSENEFRSTLCRSFEVKETVLHTKWWKCTQKDEEQFETYNGDGSFYPLQNDDDQYDVNFSGDEQFETYDGDVSFYPLQNDDGHYDVIDESKIRPTIEVKKKRSGLPGSRLSAPRKRGSRERLPPPPSKRRSGVRLPSPPMVVSEEQLHLPQQPSDLDRKTTDENSIHKQVAEGRCLEYRELVNTFKPLIVQNLIVHDVLPLLPFLDNHDDIYAESKNHSPKKAVVSLLDEIEKSQELGKWEKFIEALHDCGYSYIVDNIRGYKFISHKYQKEYIKKLTPKIGKMIAPVELLPHLLVKDIISDSDKENIHREATNHGEFAAAVMLLDRIPRKHGSWYRLFIEALIDAGMEDVAADLQIPELLVNGRTKVTESYHTEDDVSYSIPPNPLLQPLPSSIPSHQVQKTQIIPGMSSSKAELASSDKSNDTVYPPAVYDESPILTEYKPPPIPPRKPIKRKLRVPLPVCTNTDNDPFVHELEKLQPEQLQSGLGIIYVPQNSYTNFDSISYEEDQMYEKYDDAAIETMPHMTSFDLDRECTEKTDKSDIFHNAEDHKFQDLLEDLKHMKKEKQDIVFEVSLLEQKSTLHEEVNCGLKRRRELKKDILLKEKEKQALQSDLLCQEKANKADDNTDVYYPTGTNMHHEIENETPAPCTKLNYRQVSKLEKISIWRFSSLSVDSFMSIVPLYSPSFDRNSIMSQIL